MLLIWGRTRATMKWESKDMYATFKWLTQLEAGTTVWPGNHFTFWGFSDIFVKLKDHRFPVYGGKKTLKVWSSDKERGKELCNANFPVSMFTEETERRGVGYILSRKQKSEEKLPFPLSNILPSWTYSALQPSPSQNYIILGHCKSEHSADLSEYSEYIWIRFFSFFFFWNRDHLNYILWHNPLNSCISTTHTAT